MNQIYGCTGKHLHLLNTGELLYPAGSVAVIYSRVGDSQKHYTGHTADIECLAAHPGGEVVASGQGGPGGGKGEARPHVRVWNALSLETKVRGI